MAERAFLIFHDTGPRDQDQRAACPDTDLSQSDRVRSWLGGCQSIHLVSQRRLHKFPEKRMSLIRFRFELRMELAADEPRMIHKLYDLRQAPIGAGPGNDKSAGHRLPIPSGV